MKQHLQGAATPEHEKVQLMVRLTTCPVNAHAKSRVVGIRLAALTLRLRANWIKLFGDADTAAIALAIVAITADRLLREELEPGLENLAVPLPTDALASCNISSIAIASGFNRETARRKVDQLVDAGFLLREGGKIRLSQSLTQRAEAIAMVRQQVEDIRKAANDLLREGVLAIEE